MRQARIHYGNAGVGHPCRNCRSASPRNRTCLSAVPLQDAPFVSLARVPAHPHWAASAVVRGDKTLTLIEIPDFGKIQLSKDKLVLQLKDGTTVIDLSSLMTFRQSPDNLTMDAQMLTLLMMQAVQEVIMPSVEMTQNENGTVFHLSIDNQDSKTRVTAASSPATARR